jgi:hypothetical protein
MGRRQREGRATNQRLVAGFSGLRCVAATQPWCAAGEKGTYGKAGERGWVGSVTAKRSEAVWRMIGWAGGFRQAVTCTLVMAEAFLAANQRSGPGIGDGRFGDNVSPGPASDGRGRQVM